jgi:chromatin segregation and condensation protein Rec8/ScpA/Scc1 (kleisin family)
MIKQSEIICLQKENFKDIEIKLIVAEAWPKIKKL